jgi:hypothetical protein
MWPADKQVDATSSTYIWFIYFIQINTKKVDLVHSACREAFIPSDDELKFLSQLFLMMKCIMFRLYGIYQLGQQVEWWSEDQISPSSLVGLYVAGSSLAKHLCVAVTEILTHSHPCNLMPEDLY